MSTETPTYPPEQPPRRRLLRTDEDRILVGAAAGLGRYFDIDPVIFRIGFAVTSFIGGLGFALYIAMYLFVPKDDGTEDPKPLITLSRRSLGIVLACVIAVVLGMALAVGAAWAAAAGGATVVAIVVIALGVAMVAGSFLAGPRMRWLAVPALLLAAPATVVAATDFKLHGGYGQETHRPATVAAIPAGGFELAAGQMDVDLTRLDWRRGRTIDLELDQGVGETRVLVPPSVCVEADGHAGAGEVSIRGSRSDGVDIDQHVTPRESGAPRLRLDARIGLGQLTVSDRAGDFDGWARGPRPFDNDTRGEDLQRQARADAACGAA
jgi:phage shock protein PspC (stress-responsive transcriptional regulator)